VLLIEQTLGAGRVREAWELYWFGLGSYANLGQALGDDTRGLRILERFVPRDEFSLLQPQVSLHDQGVLVADLGMFAKNLGDLARAHVAHIHARALGKRPRDESRNAQNLAEVELEAGHFPDALAYSESALSRANQAEDEDLVKYSLAWRATANFVLGDITAAATDFHRATELEGEPLLSFRGIREAECKLLCGDRPGARSQTEANRETSVTEDWNQILCRCDALLTRLLLPDNPTKAAQHLQDARVFANRSGHIELQLRCFHAACELNLHLKDYPQAIAEAEAGILLADTCGFGKFSIDLRLALAETLIAAGDAHKALQNARNALDRSEQPDCQYAWGKADGLHFCGLAHLRLGERELALQRLTAALELREHLGHGRIDETRRALEQHR